MSTSIIRSPRFAPLFWTQFLGAFGDNLLKNVLVFAALFGATSESGTIVAVAGGVFILPFLVLSAFAGQVADASDKATIARRIKLAETAVAFVAAAGILWGSIPIMLAALFGYGTCSALFGPIKYGILPDHLDERDLPAANAWVEGATFAAILGGTVGGGMLSTVDPIYAATAVVGLAMLGWIAAIRIPSAPPRTVDLTIDRDVMRSTRRVLSDLRGDDHLWSTSLALSWFWAVGAFVLSVLPVAVADMGGGEGQTTIVLAAFAGAIGVGSAAAAALCSVRVALLLAPIGTISMAAFGLDLSMTLGDAPALGLRDFVDMAGLAFGGALVAVPCFSFIQGKAPSESRARTVAGVNALSAAAMVLSAVLLVVLRALDLDDAGMLLVLSAANLVAGVVMWRRLPFSFASDLALLYLRIAHRLEVFGLDRIRSAGRAPILAANHVSFLDAALLLAICDRRPVFAVDAGIARKGWVRPFLRLVEALPLDPTKPIATRTLIKSVEAGRPLVIFPEGRISITGALMKVYEGAAMIADRTGAPVIPIRIEGLERSLVSRLGDGQVRRTAFPKVTARVLEPARLHVPDDAVGRRRRAAAGAALYDVMSNLIFRTEKVDRTILERVMEAARAGGMSRIAVEDPIAGAADYGRVLTGARVLARALRDATAHERNVGLMLPSSVACVVAFLALQSAGRTPAMVNFTAGPAGVAAACALACVRTVVTSRAFVQKARLETIVSAVEGAGVSIVWLEDIRAGLSLRDKLTGRVMRCRPLVAGTPQDAAAIVFTSGSEGTPKGVVLSHVNILSNVAQVAARIDFNGRDKVFNVLPTFHSFGLTAATILPLVSGVPVYMYPSPLHYRTIPELVYATNATILFGTDTFLSGYARSANAYDFRSLRYAFAGAEPLRDATRRTWQDRFGTRVLEGYGITEASPVLALNTPMHSRPGSVGRLMPGVEWRIDPVPGIEKGGRLHVRGPNVMSGYLLADRPGVLVPPEGGWHDTGDVVSVDADGFVTIEGRAKRFAKIGGEMVSLAAVEAFASRAWPDRSLAAAAVPDDRKGERIVLLVSGAGPGRSELANAARVAGIPELAVPSEVRVVEAIPLLGTGKTDLAAVTRLARETSATAA